MRHTGGPQRTSSRRTLCIRLTLLALLSWLFILYCWISRQQSSSSSLDALIEEAKEYARNTRLINSTQVKEEWAEIAGYLRHRWKKNETTTSNEDSAHLMPPNTAGSSLVEDFSAVSQPLSEEEAEFHIIFSTDCKAFMDYQTLVLFHSAVTVGQVGPLTRIVSGCSKEREEELTSLYRKLYPQYRVHFTPDFAYDPIKKVRYVYFNKPHGLKHWLEHADPPVSENAIVALLDPDMILLRPLTAKVKGMESLYISIPKDELIEKVDRGHPVGQIYGLGAPWTIDNHKHFNRREICTEVDSPCLNTTRAFGEAHYSVGPPYILHRDDMWRIANSWTRYAPRVHKQYPELLAEMYAYSIAAAHENLPHLQLPNYMISNIHMDKKEEGWPLIDAIQDVCALPEDGKFFPGAALPSVLHYCQTYRAGDFGWAKRRPQLLDIFSCEAPLLLEPPSNLGFLDYKIRNGEVKAFVTFIKTSLIRVLFAEKSR